MGLMNSSLENTRLIKRYLLYISMVAASCLYGQEGLPVYSDYLTDNYYLLHPSTAGAASCSQIRLTARQAWLGTEDAPGLQTLSYNGRIGHNNSAIGATVFIDQNGFHDQSGMYATYAHHIMFSRDETDLNMLSFGLSAGLLQYRLDQSQFIAGFDDLVRGNLSEYEFNLDFGFSYYFNNFYTHFTAKNLIENSGINNNAQITSNLRRYLFSLGYVIDKPNSKWMWEPSILVQYRESLEQTTVDLNMKFYRELQSGKTLYGGLSYRRGLDTNDFIDVTGAENFPIQEELSYITPFIGMRFNQFKVAYTYSKQLNDVVFVQTGLHQITLGYDFNCRKKRYHCNCPALN